MNHTSEILSSETICKQSGRYIGWPSVARTSENELIAVFSGDRDAHVDPFGKTMLVRSTDNGKNWSTPEVINNTPLDDRDAGVCAFPDGGILVSWFTSHYDDYAPVWQGHARKWGLTDKEKARWDIQLSGVGSEELETWAHHRSGNRSVGYWVRYSPDGGRTWDAPSPTPCMAPHGPAVLENGSLLYVGLATINRERQLVAAKSDDRGKSWQKLADIPSLPPYPGGDPEGYAYLCEPHVVQTDSGKLVAMARVEYKPRLPEHSVLWQFESNDGGRTWTEPQPTEIWGKPPHLLRLRDGRLLVTYGIRRSPFGQRACLSADEGETWDYDNEIILRDDAPSGDLGYPASVQLDDESMLTVYYQQEKAGEKPCLMGTRWRLVS